MSIHMHVWGTDLKLQGSLSILGLAQNGCQYADDIFKSIVFISRVSCQKGPTCHACAWQIGPFWQDTLDMKIIIFSIWFRFQLRKFPRIPWTLTHWGRVTDICISRLDHHWFRQWFVTCLAPNHYLNKCSLIVIWDCRNKRQWNTDKKLKIVSAKCWSFCSGCNGLTYCGLVTTEIWVNIGWGNSLLPDIDNTKPLPEAMLTYHHWCSVVFSWKQFLEKCSWN